MTADGLPDLLPVAGFRLGTTRAAIRYPDRRDLVVMELPPGAGCAAVFTRNAFCAAPVTVARSHLDAGAPRYLLVNTGNANAGTGERGLRDARHCCTLLAAETGCMDTAVLPFSTGVIGEYLPVESIAAGLPDAVARLAEDGWAEAARGILTTDTVPKGVSRRIEIDGHAVTVTGIAKGAGMIRPDMATMLAFVATDAAVSAPLLRSCLETAVAGSFNRITVDGDTSTNDACVLVATGQGALPEIGTADRRYKQLCEAVSGVCEALARAIVRDGEGATRFVTVAVDGGRNTAECLQVAYAIAHSPLVKTALHAGDPNWGRILAAVGRAGLDGFDIDAVDIFLDDVCVIRGGGIDPAYTESAGTAVMARDEFTIRTHLGRGDAAGEVWTCDLSCDYVRINADYRT